MTVLLGNDIIRIIPTGKLWKRKTIRENKIKRPFTTIEKNGLYVKVCDIEYDDSDEIEYKNLGEPEYEWFKFR